MGHCNFNCYRKFAFFSFQGDITQFSAKQFTEFTLVVESASKVSSGTGVPGTAIQPNTVVALGHEKSDVLTPVMNPTSALSAGRTGSFQLLGDVLTRFSDHCTNTVTQTSSVAKSEIQVGATIKCLPTYNQKTLFS